MDPSPFHERDLDDDAEEFIVGWAREFPRRDPVSLVVHVNQLPAHGDAEHLLETAVHNYFAYRAKLNRLEFRYLLKQGRTSLIIGLAFLAACMLTSQLLRHRAGTLPIILREGLIIAGWVAMWRPMEIFLYDGGRSCAKVASTKSSAGCTWTFANATHNAHVWLPV
jgi:hypothetical protein